MSHTAPLPRPLLEPDEQARLNKLVERPAVQTLLALLNDEAATTLIVGGAVRNALLDYPVADIDLATTLLPEAVKARADKAGLKTVATGLEHGTLTLILQGHGFEVTTLRKDIATDGRRATIAYSTSFTEDAQRRDFTMNALYADHAGTLYDPVAGLEDLRLRHLRFIGDAQTRIREDYLRILRFFRFFAAYSSDTIDATGLAACIALKEGLTTLSRERIGHEWLKLLMARRAAETIALINRHGLTNTLFPMPLHPEHLSALLALMPDAPDMTRLFALFDPALAQIDACQSALRLSNTQTVQLRGLARALETVPQPLSAVPPHRTALQIWAFTHGPDLARWALALHLARDKNRHTTGDENASPSAVFQTLCEPLAPIPRQSPFSGRDLLAQGLKSGPHLGAMLRKADHLWIEAGFPDDPALLQALIRRVVNQEKALSGSTPQ